MMILRFFSLSDSFILNGRFNVFCFRKHNKSLTMDDEGLKCLFPADTMVIHFTGTPNKYTALLRSKCKSKDEFRQKWLREYEKISKVAMRVLLTRPKTGKTVVYKAAFRCQHNTYPASHQRVKAPHKKHTGCPAVLKVTIKASPENRRVRSVDTLRREYPTIISINHDHNHHLPSQGTPVNNDFERVKENFQEFISFEKKSNLEEPNWAILRNVWISLLEKWESSSSVHLYKALLKATDCLESCKTVNATIAALNSIGRLNKQKCSKVLIQQCVKEHLNCVNEGLVGKMEVVSPVDELLVIDQGLII